MSKNSRTLDARAVIEENCALLETVLGEHRHLQIPMELSTEIYRVIEEVQSKLGSDTLNVALIGGFSAGKSTLINAMLGLDLLASRAAPTTICPTYISHGATPVLDVVMNGLQTYLPTDATPINASIELAAEFLPGGCLSMEKIDHDIYRVAHEFQKPGTYSFAVFVGDQIIPRQISVPSEQLNVEFYYNILTHRIGTSLEYCHLPQDRLPFVVINTTSESKSEDSEENITLRNWELNGKWRGIVSLEAESSATLTLGFDVDWFISAFPVQYIPFIPVAHPKPSLFGRIRNWLKGASGSNPSAVPALRPVHRSHRPTKKKITITNPDERKKEFLLSLDLETLEFGCQIIPEVKPQTRSFFINDESAYPAVGQFIGALTSAGRNNEGNFAGSISRVNLRFPAPVLQNLVIIDTPGISAEQRHTALTMEVIDDEADACVFLCPADQAGKLTDLEFVRERLLDVSGAVIFLVTKADKADSDDELEEIMGFVSDKVCQVTGIRKPRVYAVSARDALMGRSSARQRFDKFLDELTSLTRTNQKTIMIRRLLGVQRNLIDELTKAAHAMKEEYEQELQLLRGYVIPDLRQFALGQQPRIAEQLDREYAFDRYRLMYTEPLERVREDFLSSAEALIDTADSEARLEDICKEELQQGLTAFNRYVSHLCAAQTERLDQILAEVVTRVFCEFEDSFEAMYPLKRLGVQQIIFQSSLTEVFDKSMSTQQEISIIAEGTAVQLGAGKFGAGAGAVVGSLILPGIGTLIGGIAGFFLGIIFGTDVEALKDKVKTSIRARVDGYFLEQLIPSIEAMLEQRKDNAEQILFGAVNKYLIRYERVVAELIEEHELRKAEVAQYIAKTTRLTEILEKRSQKLLVIRDSMHLGDLSRSH